MHFFAYFFSLCWTAWQRYRLSYIDARCINLSYSRKDQSLKFLRKILRIGGIEKLSFFWVSHFEFFFSKKYIFFASSRWNSVQIYRVEQMGQNFDDYPGFQTKATPTKRYATQWTYPGPGWNLWRNSFTVLHKRKYTYRWHFQDHLPR